MKLPDINPVGDMGLMLRFGDAIDPAIHAKVTSADHAIHAANIVGVTETIPSYAALFVGYDPLLTDPETLTKALARLDAAEMAAETDAITWDIPVCYDDDLAPDLDAVAETVGTSVEAVINAHLSGDYLIYMYGFAPGYAYMGGVPEALQLPRKTNPVRDVPAGSVIIAGPQCLVTTIAMPTGWWRIGQSPFPILRPNEDDPFPISVGDSVRFRRITRDEYDKQLGESI